MEKKGGKKNITKILWRIFMMVLVLSPLVSASLNVQLSDQGTGVAYSNGTVLPSGDLTVLIYDNETGGNLVYNETFISGISQGSWNVMLGAGSVDLPLEYGKVYYKDYLIAGEDTSFDGNDRQVFYSPLGDINGSKLINSSLPKNKLENCSNNEILKISSGEWVCASDATGGSVNETVWNITTSNYLINSSGILMINETLLNATIDARASGLGDNSSWNESYARDLFLENGTNLDLGDKNITTTSYGFFGWLGSLANRITKLFVQDIDASGNINASNYTLNGTTIDDWGDVGGGVDTQKKAEGYLYNDSTTIYLNDTKLNITIDGRRLLNDTNGVYIYDNGKKIYLNETKLNQTINSLDEDTLAGLGCGSNEIVKYNGSLWLCANESASGSMWNITGSDYLVNESGVLDVNETKLNASIVAAANIYNESGTNLTLADKLTFRLGEIVDNIVDSWVRVTGNLNVTGNIVTEENMSASYFIGNGRYLTDVNTISQSTGLINGGAVSVNGGDNTLIDITAGSGQIVDSTTDPDNPTLTPITWANITGYNLTTAADPGDVVAIYLSLNSSGGVVERLELPTAEERRDTIDLGIVARYEDTVIVFAGSGPTNVIHNPGSQTQDFMEAWGAFNIDGNQIQPYGTGLQIQKTEGEIFRNGVSFQTNPKEPHVNLLIEQAPVGPFNYKLGDGTDVNLSSIQLDPENYDDGTSTPAAVLTNDWTVQYISVFATGTVEVLYGQETFTKEEDAIVAIPNMDFIIPDDSSNAIPLAYVILQQGDTVVGEDRIYRITRGGTGGGGGISYTAGDGIVLNSGTGTEFSLNTTYTDDRYLNSGNDTGNFNLSGNLTLGQKLTFAFGEIIDNIVDGWVRITGNLNVTGNIETVGNITTSGRVGVGTQSPTEKLDVRNGAIRVGYETDTFDQLIEFYRNNTKIGAIDSDGSDIRLISRNGNDVKIGDDSETKMILKDGGNVGIGTTTPDQLLEIESTNNTILQITSTGGDKTASLILKRDSNVSPDWRIQNRVGWIYFGKSITDGATWSDYLKIGGTQSAPEFQTYISTGDLTLGGGDDIVFQTNDGGWAETMRLLGGGDLLIGYTTDQGAYQLQVSGDICEANTAISACSSDRRLKENIVDVKNAVDYLMNLKPRWFNFIGENKTMAGLIAQEVNETHPEIFVEKEDGYYTWENPGLDIITVKAIQELKEENDNLKEVICEELGRMCEEG